MEIFVESFAISFHISHDAKYCNDQCTILVTHVVNDARFKASSRLACVAARHIWRWRHSLKALGFVSSFGLFQLCPGKEHRCAMSFWTLCDAFEAEAHTSTATEHAGRIALLIVVGPCFRRIFLSGYSDTPDSHVLLL